VGNPRTEKSTFTFVKPLIESLFGTKVSVYINKKGNEMILTVCGKKLVEFLGEIGLLPGNKIKNGISIPNWTIKTIIVLKHALGDSLTQMVQYTH